ncbi:MAG: hypothetical protein GC149_13945 [Gammaproteobacteria bacterium]|nr:hypothetical protein [Gammaproteobacteria bacterium]
MSAASEHVIAEHTITAWCLSMADSIRQANLDAHMDRVSRRVRVYGVPSKEVIDYRDWKSRRQYEFTHGEILAVNYLNTRLVSSTQKRIRFVTTETTVGKNGKILVLNKNIILEREDDDVWRVVEENVTDWQIRNIDLSKF